MNKFIFGLIAISGGLILTACGSGDSDSPSSFQSGDSPDSALAITISNAEDVSASSLSAIDSATNASGDTVAFSASIEGEGQTFEISQFVRHLLTHLPEDAFQDSDLATGIVINPTTFDCSDPDVGGVSGQITISGNLASQSTLTAGDELNSEFFNCEIEPGLVGDGEMNFVINSFSGDLSFTTPPYQLGVDVTFVDFTVTSGLDSYFADGGMTMDMSIGVDNIQTLLASGDFITVREGASTQIRLFDYEISEVIDFNNNSYIQEQSGTVDSSVLGGSVSFTTTLPFEGILGEFPDVGTLLMTGDNSSAARLVVIDEVNVQIFVDEDGDGTFDAPTTVAWVDLEL